MKSTVRKAVYMAVAIAGSIAVAKACYQTIFPVCVPAGTPLISDDSIELPCTIVTDATYTGADAYYPDVASVDCGGSGGTVGATIDNIVPVVEVSGEGTGTINGTCTVVTEVIGYMTIPCSGTEGDGSQCCGS